MSATAASGGEDVSRSPQQQSAASAAVERCVPDSIDLVLCCPVCFEPCNPAFTFRACMHRVCGVCAPKLNGKCPMCRVASQPVKDAQFTSLVESAVAQRKYSCLDCGTGGIVAPAQHVCDDAIRQIVDQHSRNAAQAGVDVVTLKLIVEDCLRAFTAAGDGKPLPALDVLKLELRDPVDAAIRDESRRSMPVFEPQLVTQQNEASEDEDEDDDDDSETVCYIDYDQFSWCGREGIEPILRALRHLFAEKRFARRAQDVKFVTFGQSYSYRDQDATRALARLGVECRIRSSLNKAETDRQISEEALPATATNVRRVVAVLSSDQDFAALFKRLHGQGVTVVAIHDAPNELVRRELTKFADFSISLGELVPALRPKLAGFQRLHNNVALQQPSETSAPASAQVYGFGVVGSWKNDKFATARHRSAFTNLKLHAENASTAGAVVFLHGLRLRNASMPDEHTPGGTEIFVVAERRGQQNALQATFAFSCAGTTIVVRVPDFSIQAQQQQQQSSQFKQRSFNLSDMEVTAGLLAHMRARDEQRRQKQQHQPRATPIALHDQLCRYYNNSCCRNKKECPRLHLRRPPRILLKSGGALDGALVSPSQVWLHPENAASNSLCKSFSASGTCRFGTACIFVHGQAQPQQQPHQHQQQSNAEAVPKQPEANAELAVAPSPTAAAAAAEPSTRSTRVSSRPPQITGALAAAFDAAEDALRDVRLVQRGGLVEAQRLADVAQRDCDAFLAAVDTIHQKCTGQQPGQSECDVDAGDEKARKAASDTLITSSDELERAVAQLQRALEPASSAPSLATAAASSAATAAAGGGGVTSPTPLVEQGQEDGGAGGASFTPVRRDFGEGDGAAQRLDDAAKSLRELLSSSAFSESCEVLAPVTELHSIDECAERAERALHAVNSLATAPGVDIEALPRHLTEALFYAANALSKTAAAVKAATNGARRIGELAGKLVAALAERDQLFESYKGLVADDKNLEGTIQRIKEEVDAQKSDANSPTSIITELQRRLAGAEAEKRRIRRQSSELLTALCEYVELCFPEKQPLLGVAMDDFVKSAGIIGADFGLDDFVFDSEKDRLSVGGQGSRHDVWKAALHADAKQVEDEDEDEKQEDEEQEDDEEQAQRADPIDELFVLKKYDIDREQFYQLVRLLSRIEHPNIMPLVAAFDADSAATASSVSPTAAASSSASRREAYIVTRYCSGGNFRRYIEKHQKESRGGLHMRRIFVELLRALDYLHACVGVAHGNVKSTNIVMSSADADATPFLTDFDACRPIEQLSQPIAMTAATVEALQQSQSSAGADTSKIDIRSLGVMYLEARLPGFLEKHDQAPGQPTGDFTAVEIDLVKHMLDQPTGDFTAVEIDLVKHMLDPDPKQRWSAARCLMHPALDVARQLQLEVAYRREQVPLPIQAARLRRQTAAVEVWRLQLDRHLRAATGETTSSEQRQQSVAQPEAGVLRKGGCCAPEATNKTRSKEKQEQDLLTELVRMRKLKLSSQEASRTTRKVLRGGRALLVLLAMGKDPEYAAGHHIDIENAVAIVLALGCTECRICVDSELLPALARTFGRMPELLRFRCVVSAPGTSHSALALRDFLSSGIAWLGKQKAEYSVIVTSSHGVGRKMNTKDDSEDYDAIKCGDGELVYTSELREEYCSVVDSNHLKMMFFDKCRTFKQQQRCSAIARGVVRHTPSNVFTWYCTSPGADAYFQYDPCRGSPGMWALRLAASLGPHPLGALVAETSWIALHTFPAAMPDLSFELNKQSSQLANCRFTPNHLIDKLKIVHPDAQRRKEQVK